MKFTSEKLKELVISEGLCESPDDKGQLSEGGLRAKRSALASANAATEILARRINLIVKDIARLKNGARELERAGYTWQDHAYRSLLADIGDLERTIGTMMGSVKLVQRDVASLPVDANERNF